MRHATWALAITLALATGRVQSAPPAAEPQAVRWRYMILRLSYGGRVLLAATAALAAACGDVTLIPPIEVEPEQVPLETTVVLTDLGPDCWALMLSTGFQLEPVGLPEAFKVDSLAVRATVRSTRLRWAPCGIGPIVQVIEIQRR